MEIKSKFDHFNINVTNLERSIAFYEKALGLKEHHRKESSDGSFTLVYLTDGSTDFLLEQTCLKEHPQAYELGENESHLCFRVAGDYEAIRQYHKENGWCVSRIPRWDYISSMTLTITGLRYYRPGKYAIYPDFTLILNTSTT